MSDRDWEGELRQVIVLADMQGADKREVTLAFDRGLREAHSEKGTYVRPMWAIAGWLVLVGAITHAFAIVAFVMWLTGALR